ncbi:MAG: hypothetical protein PHQ52_00775 [Candidatus Omnitrophica bacterium]|nr:hypothetical protein [Candidatus Omnitrophota bacterium]
MKKKGLFLLVIIVLSCFMVTAVYAQAQKEKEQKPWWKRIFSYPVKVTEESVNITADAVKTTGKGAKKELENLKGMAQGDKEMAKQVVTDPIVGTGNNIADTSKKIVDMPKTAAQE